MDSLNNHRCSKCARTLLEGDSFVIHVIQEQEVLVCRDCDELDTIRDFEESRILTTQLVILASLAKFYYEEATDRTKWAMPSMSEDQYPPIVAASDAIHEAIKMFERRRWFEGGLQDAIVGSKSSTLTGCIGGVDVRVLSLCGRCMITIEDRETSRSVTLITAEDEGFVRWQKVLPGGTIEMRHECGTVVYHFSKDGSHVSLFSDQVSGGDLKPEET